MTTARRRPTVKKLVVLEERSVEPVVEFPLVDVRGSDDGPTVAIIAGMHAGEYAGVLATQKLISLLETALVSGRILIVPIVSVRAFYARNMQLSPVDQKEVHYLWPGRPTGSFSDRLIDLLFRTLRVANAVVDMHGGEFVQDLTPFVGVPWERDDDLFARSLELAHSFDVPFVDQRAVAETPIALPRALYREGIPNIWSEIGHNGLPGAVEVNLQFDGCRNVLRQLGVIGGRPVRHRSRVVGPKHWSVVTDTTGIWLPKVRAGQHVRKGQVLGRMTDVFGRPTETVTSPADALVEFLCTSPAVDGERRPHGNTWHQWLVQLVDDRGVSARRPD
jgi:predicted deacylase